MHAVLSVQRSAGTAAPQDSGRRPRLLPPHRETVAQHLSRQTWAHARNLRETTGTPDSGFVVVPKPKLWLPKPTIRSMLDPQQGKRDEDRVLPSLLKPGAEV